MKSILAAVLVALFCLPAAARRYPITRSDSSGTWVGTRDALLHGVGELWKRYSKKNKALPVDRINDLELSSRDVWVATPGGLARMNKGSRRWETFGPPELPSAAVTSVSIDSSDPDQVWVGTLGGLARYNVRTNQWRRWVVGSGLPNLRVNDVLFRGRTVWAATDAGLVAYDTRLRTFKTYRRKDGLASDKVLEIDEQGSDLWLVCSEGLSRMNQLRRSLVALRKAEGLPGTRILAQARLQNLMYIVTDGGLITYDTNADSLAPFLHKKGLGKTKVRSVATAGGFVWFGTNNGLARFEPTKKVWEYYRVEDGLSTEALQQLAVSGNLLLLFGDKQELDTYDYKKDEWMERSDLLASAEQAGDGSGGSDAASQPTTMPGGEKKPKRLTLSFSAELDTELKQDFTWPEKGSSEREGYWLVNTLRLGAGAHFASGRKVDLSANIDWGDISPLFEGESSTLESFQDYDLDLRYLGKPTDLLQEVRLSNEIRLQPPSGPLADKTEIEGGRMVLAAGPAREGGRLATATVSAGIRRGTPTRVVFRRPDVASLQIKRFKLFRQTSDGSTRDVRQIIPSTVRAMLDGRELDRNVDYFVDHDNGVLWFKNTDLIHVMRTLEVEFEYEQIPRKNIGAVSVADMLPKDGDIGQLTRSGRSRWAKDEQGLFDEIDGGADQFINRGWVKTVSQDFDWTSAGIILRIHDMGDEKAARSIFLSRKLPDAKPVPGLADVFIERQTSSIAIKLVSGQFYIEVSIDQASMEQEILAIAGWLVTKLAASGSTSADALRDLVTSAAIDLRLTNNTRLGLSYVGTYAREDTTLQRREKLLRTAQDLLMLHASHRQRLGKETTLAARLQAAGTSNAIEGIEDKLRGGGLGGSLLLTSPKLVVRASGRKYTADYAGISVARQTEFCRTADGRCTMPGQSRLDHEMAADATLRAVQWLPLGVAWQRQSTTLGDDYDDAPADRDRVGLRDVATAKLSLDHAKLPKLSAEGGLVRRSDALAEQQQWRTAATVESDLGAGLLSGLKFKRLYLRGLYEYAVNAVDEFRDVSSDEQDRDEQMHHVVGELKLAPTLTESAHAAIEYHRLRGGLDSSDRIVDRLTYWRLDTGAGSSILPGVALRFDGAFWFGDDHPRLVPNGTATEEQRAQEANTRLAGVVDFFFGEWVKPLAPLKLNAAYTYTIQTSAEARRVATVPFGQEVCDVAGDEDGDGLEDCADPDCALADICLQRTTRTQSHRAYGTLFWDTPGKLQVEIFGDIRFGFDAVPDEPDASDRDGRLRSTRQELRSYVTWRPIYSSPLTLRFDLLRETKRPSDYDGIEPLVEPVQTKLEPTLEWRRRWSARWWHLAKLSFSYGLTRDLPHIRTIEDEFGRKGDLERLDYNDWAIKPSIEIRRRFEDEGGKWNFRPYIRASYNYRSGRGVRSRIDDQVFGADDAGLADGSETSHLAALSFGLIWVHSENIFVDLDLTGGYFNCIRAATGSVCNDRFTFTPHLLATMRY